jgi:NDP-sugar pyrophosphorylase family protein
MIYIAHRINTIKELQNIHSDFGIEMDVRDHLDDIIVTHDPYTIGPSLDEYLAHYKHKFLIVNVKSEGIEYRIIELLKKYNITEYFFLDCSFPMIWKLSNLGNTNIAVRYSEFESLETVISIAKRVQWIWVDCFSHLPLNSDIISKIRALGLKICIVSPELQGQLDKIPIYKKQLDLLMQDRDIIDMICTKWYNIPKWHNSTLQVIIPMSGIGKRFIDAGYTEPKPLIKVDDKYIIEHVVNLFPKEQHFHFICNDKHMRETDIISVLLDKSVSSIPNGRNISIYDVPVKNRQGPVHAIQQLYANANQTLQNTFTNNISNRVNLDTQEIIVSYCDYGTKWNFEAFLEDCRNKNVDGAIACYKGFHPHMLGTDNYAFVKTKMENYTPNGTLSGIDTRIMEEIREKQPFTNNKMLEWASNGTYYFKTGAIMKKYFNELIESNFRINNEFYVSMVYNLMVRDGLTVSVFEIDNMLQWGTPYDLAIYTKWSDYFTKILKPIPIIANVPNTTTILPMAGAGSRFSMKDYLLPKPLLNVNGMSMVIQAINCLPNSDNTIFIYLKEHLEKYHTLEAKLRTYDKESCISVIGINNITEGQACTCKIGINYGVENNILNLDNPILISACDNGVYYNSIKYQEMLDDDSIDIIVWSFRNNQTSKVNPNMYAWLDVDENGFIRYVSCKKFIYDDPLKTHAIIGTMFFRKSRYFLDGLEKNINDNIRTNNEFYVDDVLNQNIKSGLKVKVFEVDHYICWGTPDDYQTYLYWQDFFDKCWWHPYKKILDSTTANYH